MASLLRALRARGPMTTQDCVTVLKNNHDVLTVDMSSRVVRRKGKVWLRIEWELINMMPINMSDLPKSHRILFIEHVDRLPIKRARDGTLMHASKINAVCINSLLKKMAEQTAGFSTRELVGEYAGIHTDIVELVQRGDAIVIGDRIWATLGPPVMEGAADEWQAHHESHADTCATE